jgi:hypothetical protein
VVTLLVLAAIAGAIGLGVPGIRIILGPGSTPTVAPTTPAPGSSAGAVGTPTPTPSPTTRPVAPGLELGRLVNLDEARTAAGFAVLVPIGADLPEPSVFVSGTPPLTRISLSFGDRGLLTQFLGEANPEGFQKILEPGTRLEVLTINGKNAYWITGGVHALRYTVGDGRDRWEETRITGNVLIWQAGEITLRFETTRDRTFAERVAGSMH